MIVLVNPDDTRAVRNKNLALELYQTMINDKQSALATASHLAPDYIQHNPLIPDGAKALGAYFGKITSERNNARVEIYRIIAVENYVWAHVNFVNLFDDDPDDTGVAGVDIYRFDDDGRVVEHWDALQIVGTPENSAPWVGLNIPRANPHEMF
ncbi:nuclear transport factor 2 family protein [Sphingomonas sp. UYP23]